jgi:hypothetical protein
MALSLSHCAECHYAECHYAECHFLNVILNVIMLNVIMLNVMSCCHAECHYAECHYAECHCTECRGANRTSNAIGPLKLGRDSIVFFGYLEGLFTCAISESRLRIRMRF